MILIFILSGVWTLVSGVYFSPGNRAGSTKFVSGPSARLFGFVEILVGVLFFYATL
jgi:hypothetical protein